MTIPTPPNPGERSRYLDPRKGLLYTFSIPSLGVLTVGTVLFCSMHPVFLAYAPFAVLTIGYLWLTHWIGLRAGSFDYMEHQTACLSLEVFPEIDVFLPTCGEEIGILENTYRAVAMMRVDWGGKLNVWVLDDGAREEVEALAARFGYHYIVRPTRPALKKAGNLRYAFGITNAPFILILDADFAPRRDMLRNLYTWMTKDPRIAIVQSPQYFDSHKGMNWVERGAGYVQELFYRLIQVSRDHYGAAICVGSCALYRRKALEPFGGTAPIGYSEDVHTGFNCLLDGWKVKYLPIVLSKGVCPDTPQAFFSQQYRWAMGSLTLASNPLFWRNKVLNWSQRACFVSGFGYYISTGMGVILTPLPGVLIAWIVPEKIHWYSVAFFLPSLAYGTLGVAMWNQAPFSFFSHRVRVLQSWSHLFAIVDKVRGDTMPWIPTGGEVSVKGRFWFAKVISMSYASICWIGLCYLLIPRLYLGEWDVLPSILVGGYHFYFTASCWET